MTYAVIRRLGRGGMGVVDLVAGPDGQQLALKRLPLHGSDADMDRARARIRREAAVLRSLEHPAIVRLLDVVDDVDDVVLVMPYLSGGTLHDRVTTEGPLHPNDVAVIADRLLDALAAAHRQGVVHRDIKPANVLFDEAGAAYLADFGVASARDHTVGLTATEMVVGTPGFMAPEQARGDEATAASDVFSLGATLLFAATGSGPFGPLHVDPRVLMWRAAQGRVDRIPKTLPAGVRDRLAPLLDRDPTRRPSAARARGGPAGTWPVTGLQSAVHRHRRAWLIVAAALVVLAVAAAAAAVLVSRADRSPAGAGDRKVDRTPASSVSTVACRVLPYRGCASNGPLEPAPFTDGRTCISDHDDYDADRTNGCEAAPDGVPVATELQDTLRANLVPRDDADEWRLPVQDRVQLLCDGKLRVTLTAPSGTSMRLRVLEGAEVLGETVSADRTPASVQVTEPSCGGDDSTTLIAQVSSIGTDRSAANYTLESEGSL